MAWSVSVTTLLSAFRLTVVFPIPGRAMAEAFLASRFASSSISDNWASGIVAIIVPHREYSSDVDLGRGTPSVSCLGAYYVVCLRWSNKIHRACKEVLGSAGTNGGCGSDSIPSCGRFPVGPRDRAGGAVMAVAFHGMRFHFFAHHRLWLILSAAIAFLLAVLWTQPVN